MPNDLEKNKKNHQFYMKMALEQADLAEDIGEVPVGAVVVIDNEVVGVGYNRCIIDSDPSLHAEMVAIRDASKRINNYRLVGASLYVTLEPCSMCAGLLVHSRLKQLIFGAHDPKAGAAGSIMNLVQHEKLNHKIDIVPNVLEDVCSDKLSDFFRKRRAHHKIQKALDKERASSN
jgi:tRNA(adenine34) deaminase